MSEDYFEAPGGYNTIVKGFGTILLQADVGSYQGTNYWLLDGSRFLSYGYGSCSGCDSLEACNSQQDWDELVESMRSSIHEEPSNKAMAAWIQDTENHKYDWDEPEFQEFVRKAVAILEDLGD